MKYTYLFAAALLTHVAHAQTPVLLAQLPAANAAAVAPGTAVELTFSQPMSAQAASAAGVRVVSEWRGALPGTYAGAGTTHLTFVPAAPLRGGEPVQVTLTTQATSQAGAALAAPVTYRFRVAAGGTGQFIDEDVPAGATPRSIAVGDINRDGNPDFVSTGHEAAFGPIGVWLGDGQGGYLPPPAPIASGIGLGFSQPDQVALADVNGDGFLDVVGVVNGQFGQYGVALGDGTGRFTYKDTEYGNGGVYNLATGDLNEDGRADMIMAGKNVVQVRLGAKEGYFTAGDDVPAPYAYGVTLADVNGDRHLDMLVLGYNKLLVRLGDGTGKFTATAGTGTAVGSGAAVVAVGDVNEDGKPDCLTSNLSDNTVSVRLGDGAGSFVAAATAPDVAVGPSPHNLALADYNRDGHLDFVCSTRDGFTTTTVSVRLGDGRGGFRAAPVPELTTGIQPDGLALTDCNRDGQPDLLVGNVGYPSGNAVGSYGTVSVRLGDGAGNFRVPAAPRVMLDGKVQFTRVGDVNNDGRLDLLTLGYGSAGGTVSVRLGRGNGQFERPPAPVPASVSTGLVNEDLAVGDINNDGNLDFVVDETPSFQGSDRPVTFFGDGKGNFTPLPITSSALFYEYLREMQLVDVTGDGVLDLLSVTQPSSGNLVRVAVRRGDGSGKFGEPLTTLFVPSLLVRLGDVNGDGRLDMLLGQGDQVVVRLGDGQGGFPAELPNPATLPNQGGIVELAVADLNGDNKLDLVVCDGVNNNGTVFYTSSWVGDGQGGFQPVGPDLTLGYTYPSGLVLGDLNGDGRPDLAVSSNEAGQELLGDKLTLAYGDGKGGFARPVAHGQLTAGVWPGDLVLADVDNDNDLDLLMPNFHDPSVSVRLNGPAIGSVLPVRGPAAGSNAAPALTVYPNPTHGPITVTGANAAAPFVLYDLLGRECSRQPFGTVLNTAGLPAGLYLLRCGTQATRLVVQ